MQYRIDLSRAVRVHKEILEQNAAFTQLLFSVVSVICTPGRECYMVLASYDIFRRDEHEALVWVERVSDLAQARARMMELSHEQPGQYMVVHAKTGRTVTAGTIVTSASERTNSRDSGETLIG